MLWLGLCVECTCLFESASECVFMCVCVCVCVQLWVSHELCADDGGFGWCVCGFCVGLVGVWEWCFVCVVCGVGGCCFFV